jgi:hypothetical protein
VGSVFDYGQLIPIGQRTDRRQIARFSRNVNGNDGASASRDATFCIGRIDIEAALDAVTQHRAGAEIRYDLGGGRKGVSREKHFIAGSKANCVEG